MTPNITVVLYEAVHAYRQIFTDGRPLPKDPNPNWMGYSIGRWEGDTFVVESAGFNDNVWLDNGGHPATENPARHRALPSQGLLGTWSFEVTIDDPKGVHETVERDDTARAAGRYRDPGIHLPRE